MTVDLFLWLLGVLFGVSLGMSLMSLRYNLRDRPKQMSTQEAKAYLRSVTASPPDIPLSPSLFDPDVVRGYEAMDYPIPMKTTSPKPWSDNVKSDPIADLKAFAEIIKNPPEPHDSRPIIHPDQRMTPVERELALGSADPVIRAQADAGYWLRRRGDYEERLRRQKRDE